MLQHIFLLTKKIIWWGPWGPVSRSFRDLRWDTALLNCGSCVMSEVKRFTATCGGHAVEKWTRNWNTQSFILPKQLLDNIIIIIIIIIIIMVYHGQVCCFCINSECNHSPLKDLDTIAPFFGLNHAWSPLQAGDEFLRSLHEHPVSQNYIFTEVWKTAIWANSSMGILISVLALPSPQLQLINFAKLHL